MGKRFFKKILCNLRLFEDFVNFFKINCEQNYFFRKQ